jgi:putative peptidoglycan lipid II flippase
VLAQTCEFGSPRRDSVIHALRTEKGSQAVDDDARRAAARADVSAAAAPDTARSPGDEHAGAAEVTTAITEPIEAARCAGPVGLVPGTTLAGGRYRLLVFHGGPDGLQFWQALDTALLRQVAITIVGPDGSLPDSAVDQILTSTLRLRRVDHPGIARLLDVAWTERGGMVVAEWLRGGSLVEVADTAPSPLGAARALGSLVAVAEAAHRSGRVLSIDHPSRVRVSTEGHVALAFPATMPHATAQLDIAGIGAAFYALLVRRWPLPESGAPSGLRPAERDRHGQPDEPQVLNLDIPFPISTVAARAVQSGGGIASATQLGHLLAQAIAYIDPSAPISAVIPRPRRALIEIVRSRLGWRVPMSQAAFRRRRTRLLAGVGVGAAVIAVSVLMLASVLNHALNTTSRGLNASRLGIAVPSISQSSSPSPLGVGAAGAPVKPVKAMVFSPGGDADNPDQADQAIDGDPAKAWSTDTYFDAAPFPKFKSGVGLLLQLPKPVAVDAVSLDVPSTGTQVQIRSSPTADPNTLSDTAELTPATLLQPGHNRIAINNAPPTSTVLVWICTLGTIDGQSRSAISELQLQAAS